MSAVAELVEAHRAYLEGDVVRGVDAVRARAALSAQNC